MPTLIPRFVRLGVGTALMLATTLVSAAPLPAQYFGRNQVQYRTFDFRILRTEHFDVYFYPEAEDAAREAARMAERWYARFSQVLDHEFSERQPLILFANHPEFQQNNIIGDPGEGVQGVTEALKQRIVLPFMHSLQETDHLIGHELVHAFQYDISGLGRAGAGLEAAARRFQAPLWFIEGMAEYLSVGPIAPHTAMWLRDAALTGQVPNVEQMTRDPRVNPYRWGHAFWSYVGGRWGDAVIGQILKQVGQGVPYPDAFQRILNASLTEIGEEWQTAIRRAYLPMLAERREAREVARPLITRSGRGGRINLAPSISPDGSRVAFLSELGQLDIELFVADAETGEVIRRLVRGAAVDPHFGSLRFIASAGTWSPDGRQFAFSALRGGTDVLVILDVERARIVREVRVPGVGEIANPSWSPDGRTIAFSGLAGGFSNLYAVDLQTGESRQLTSGREADLQPAFSPDGGTIAFVTERGPESDLGRLHFHGYRLALLELASGEIRFVPGTAGGSTNINPVWTHDGQGLYFVSNRTGIGNIYRVALATGELFKITDLFTGVSGITELSPAITLARDTDRLLFSAYEAGGYNIYSMTERTALAGQPVPMAEIAAADTVVPAAGLLPPVPRPQEAPFNRVAALLSNPTFGLPSPEAALAYEEVPYRPRLSLDWLGQPQVGVGVGGGVFGGTTLYGGVTGIFSDMLGRHTVLGTVQAQGQLDEIGFATIYLYRRTRWNYGVGLQRIPQIYGWYQEGFAGDGTFRQQILRYRVFDTSLQGVAQYPFSRVQRVEFTAGARRLSQDIQVYERAFDAVTGGFLGDRQFDESGPSFNLVEGSAALVYDNSLFGWTSPFAGQRYRFELAPTVGSLRYLQALADYRRYFWLQPLTLATRGLHFGRYGEEDRQDVFGRGVFLGHPSLVRGYNFNDVYDGCRARNVQQNPDCQLLTQLFGSRIGLVNAELRFPLFRQVVLGVAPVGLPPIEGFVFFDAGVAWDRGQRPVFERGIQADAADRGILTSAGVGARVNLFNILILEVDYVNAHARDRGWHWQFALQPGF